MDADAETQVGFWNRRRLPVPGSMRKASLASLTLAAAAYVAAGAFGISIPTGRDTSTAVAAVFAGVGCVIAAIRAHRDDRRRPPERTE